MKSWAIYIIAALGFAIYGVVNTADRDDAGAIIGAGSIDAFHVRIGDCFDDTNEDDDGINSLPGVPCDKPHDNETYAVFDLSVATYPQGDGMSELAHASCLEHFESFVGRDYDSSSLDITTLYPSADSWNEDDREVVCAVYDMELSKLEGSVKNSGI